MIIICVNRWNLEELSWYSRMMAKTLLANNLWEAPLERLSNLLQQRKQCSQIWRHKSSSRWWFRHLISRVKTWECKNHRSVKTTYYRTDNVRINSVNNALVEASKTNEEVRVYIGKICSDCYQSCEVCRGRLYFYYMVDSGSKQEEQNRIKTSEAKPINRDKVLIDYSLKYILLS